jgi:hypothetical protein
MDICKTKDGKFSLLEIGAFNCAGLYNCNLDKIVTEVSKVTEDIWLDMFSEVNK